MQEKPIRVGGMGQIECTCKSVGENREECGERRDRGKRTQPRMDSKEKGLHKMRRGTSISAEDS
jgi:hypothetical protein